MTLIRHMLVKCVLGKILLQLSQLHQLLCAQPLTCYSCKHQSIFFTRFLEDYIDRVVVEQGRFRIYVLHKRLLVTQRYRLKVQLHKVNILSYAYCLPLQTSLSMPHNLMIILLFFISLFKKHCCIQNSFSLDLIEELSTGILILLSL